MLGLDIDFEHITSRKASAKEMEFIAAHKKAVEEGEVLTQHNKDLEEELQRLNEELKGLNERYKNLQEERSCDYIVVHESIEKVKGEINEYEKKKASREQYYTNMKNEQAVLVRKDAERILSEKEPVLRSVKGILEAKKRMAEETKARRDQQRVEERKLYKSMAENNVKHYEKEKALLLHKYTTLIDGQQKEYDRYVALYKDFRQKKK